MQINEHCNMMIELMQKSYNCKGAAAMSVIRIADNVSNSEKTKHFKDKVSKDIIGVVKKFKLELAA